MSLSRSLQYAFIAIVTLSVGFSLYQWNASRASTAKTAPNNGLVGYWSFDEGTGTQAGDASGNNNTGTLTNGPTWTTGKLGKAVNLDGGDDYIAIPENSVLYLTNNLTISAWVYYNGGGTPATADYILDGAENIFNNGYALYRMPDQTITFYGTGTSCAFITSTGAIPVGAWAYTSVTYDGSNMKIYINGTLDKTVACTGSITNNATIRRIGGQVKAFDQAGHFWSGKIDEVRIYNRALSGTEVTNLYNLGAEKLNISPTTSLTSGLVGYWTFDGKDTPWTSSSAGTATDRSGNGNTGTLTNMNRATSPVSGKLGQALNFDGVNDYVTVPQNASINTFTAVTVSAWIRTSSASTTQIFLRKNNNTGGVNHDLIQLDFLSSKLRFSIAANGGGVKTTTSATTIVSNTWYHIVGVYDGTNVTAYINGVVDGTPTAATGTISTSTSNSLYFASDEGPSTYLIGTMDDVRIYNRALSAGEIQSLYDLGASDKVNSSVSQNQGVGRLDSGLVGYWKLDDASGTTATDSSANANNGTLTGGPTWGAGHIGSAVDFTGTEYVSIPNSAPLQITGNLSVSFWIYMTSYAAGGGAWTPIINKFNIDSQNEFNFRFSDSTTGQYYYGDGSGANGFTTWNPSADIPLNNWTHVVLTRNLAKNEAAIYFNGVKKRTGTTSGAVTSTTQPVQIGAGPNGGVSGRSFDGNIDEVRIYNRAISDDEISQLYRLTAPTGVDTSLKGYWSFNGPDLSGTTAYDRSGAGNNGTLTNGPTKTIGKSGQALSFDGTNDLVDAGDMPSIEGQSAVTISAWMKPSALVDWASVASKYVSLTSDTTLNEGGTGLGSNSGFIASIRNGSDTYGYTGSGKLSVGNWTFVSMVFDGTQTGNANRLKIYVNGVNEALTFNGTIPATTVSNSQNMLIGKTGSASNYFNGSIDEVRIYNRALSATEVAALYNSGR